jgi:hypothetical protein
MQANRTCADSLSETPWDSKDLVRFRLGAVAVTLDIGSVTQDTVHIKEVLIAGPEVTYEWKFDGSNLEVLQRNVEKFAGIGGGDSKSWGWRVVFEQQR